MQRLRLTVFVAASLVAHATLGVLDVRKPGRPESRARSETQPAYVEFSLEVAQEARKQPALEREETARPEPDRAHQRSREPYVSSGQTVETVAARSAAKQTPLPQAEPDVAPTTPSPSATLELSPTAPSPQPPAREPVSAPKPDLSPLAAARSIVDVRAAPDAALASGRARKTEERGVSLDEYLAHAALNHSLTRADDPVLEKKPDGYAFSGNGFDAKIARDGSVRFTDRYGTAGFVLKPEVRPDGDVTFVIFRANFDLTAWAEHLAGNDPYRSERRWFLERTAELREGLALEDFRVRSQRAEEKLKLALRKIWDDPSQNLRRQKQATFALWDECADDEIGARGRRIVEAHIVEQCPLGSGCAFSEHDLAQLNARRHSRKPFAP